MVIADFYHVFVTKVRPIFQGLPDDVAPAIRLVHTGNARFYSREGLIREFTHAARVTFAFQDDADGASFGQSEEFISLSPFGPWRADLALSGANRNISFENLEDIFLEFELKYLPRSF